MNDAASSTPGAPAPNLAMLAQSIAGPTGVAVLIKPGMELGCVVALNCRPGIGVTMLAMLRLSAARMIDDAIDEMVRQKPEVPAEVLRAALDEVYHAMAQMDDFKKQVFDLRKKPEAPQ